MITPCDNVTDPKVSLLNTRPHRVHSLCKMRPTATDGVAWSVGLSVGHVSDPAKTTEPIEMPFGG